MNTSALKTFAPAVRRQLMEAVTRKLDFVLAAQTPDYLTTYKTQVEALRKPASEDRPGLVERVAYTWFNRLAALRYLDAKGWHPFRARVLTAATPEETQPELLKLMRAGSLPEELRRHTDPARLNDLLDGRIPSPDPQGEVYRQLVSAACRFYHALLPNLFERLDDETELLLPDDLLTEHSVAQGFRAEISDEDCAEVELLGWLYQFYISEKKDAVLVQPRILALQDVRFDEGDLREYIRALKLGELFNQPVMRLMRQFEQATTFGSLIQPCLGEADIISLRRAIEEKDLGSQLFLYETHGKVLRVLEQAEMLTQRYHVVVANPPYMGGGNMNPEVKQFLANSFSSGKGDISAAFMLRSLQSISPNGYFAAITFQNWMFISSFEHLRLDLLSLASLSSLIHCGRGVWGADFGSCAFVFERTTNQYRRGHFRRLFVQPSKVRSNQQLETNYFDLKSFPIHATASQQFRRIDGAPVAYWLSEGELNCFKNPALKNFASSGGRCKTHDDENFVRFLWEVSSKAISQKGVSGIVFLAIEHARADWDNFEISWDFRDLPLLRAELKAETLAASWENWKAHCDAAIRRMQELETENNRLFIEAYGLQDELSPEVPEDQITLAGADERKDVAAFLSYAVGCMMGRYSLDKSGLILADAGDTLANYVAKVGKPIEKLRFAPDEDGIIPVLDGEWFEEDVVERAREFLRATFGKATLSENLRFIEESLGKDLRKYFLTDFYKNHISNERAYGYKKRPIYWLVQSPQKGFSALIYLHHYTRDTMNLVLNRYLRPYQEKLRSRLTHLAQAQIGAASSTRDKTAARKEAGKLTRILRECEEWERRTLLPLAQARIELDLDDGVKVNYQKLGEALAPIPGLAAKDEE